MTGSPWCLKIDVDDVLNRSNTVSEARTESSVLGPNEDESESSEVESRKVQFKGRFCVVKVGLPTSPLITRDNLPDTDPMIALHLNVSGTDMSSTIYEYWADRVDYFNREFFYFSTCFPSKCSHSDISSIVGTISNNDTQLDVKLTKYCNSVEEEKTKDVPLRATLCLAAIIVLILLVISCTVVNQIIKSVTPGNEEDRKTFASIDNFTKHFNLLIAHEKLLTSLDTPAARRMKSMDFYITIVQVTAVMAHVWGAGIFIPAAFPVFYKFENFYPSGNELFFYTLKHASLYLGQGSQLFYVVAGFFCCYIVYPMMKKAAARKGKDSSGRIPFHFFIFKRWLRTAPVLIFTLLVYFASDHFISHPITREAIETRYQEPCLSGWWKTIFMINNFDKPLCDVCILQSWFLSVDFQLWILAYIPLMFLVRKPKLAIGIVIFYMFFGVISQMVLFAIYDLPSFLTGREFDTVRFFMYDPKMIQWFTLPNNGMFPYFFGFLVAYLCLTNEIKSPVSFYTKLLDTSTRTNFLTHFFHSSSRQSTSSSCGHCIKYLVLFYSHQFFGHKSSNYQPIVQSRYFLPEFFGCLLHC